MRDNDSAIALAPIAVPSGRGSGTLLAALGVTAFSLTFPATAWALEGMGPWTVTAGRTALAGLIAVCWLALARTPPPERRHWPGLATVAAGCVLGFPLLTTLALRTSGTAHSAVVVGLLPLTTAGYAALRSGARLSPAFWAAAGTGGAAVALFAAVDGGGLPSRADLLLGVALLLCAAGYGEGGRLARELPGREVMFWALAASLPFALPALAAALAAEPARPTGRAAAGLLWLAVGSSLLGMVLWYRGLALAGVARGGQLQLAQPLLTVAWSVLLLGERLPPAALPTAAAVLLCIAATQRAPRARSPRDPLPAPPPAPDAPAVPMAPAPRAQ
ncbi:DMT family transporter [Streptomyces sp. DSM 44917]|uniref:DMT family transporter n=1 Tax=Streptomyces boetiae TaxID=3075541 RepID=A0ABU2L3K4_9ACTN|nr:DMT family transporter [Streptomyces sp. DSM 44917]MDT0305996.1 DMT family transporter [Streptomyces sp. DSM 44917]